jgi:hypothetical protein
LAKSTNSNNSLSWLLLCRTQSLGSPLFKFTKQKQCTAQNFSSNDDIRVKTRKEADKYFEAEMKQSKINATSLALPYLVIIISIVFIVKIQTNVHAFA